MRIAKISKNNISYNLIIYFFLLWNAIKLFLINTDPIIQILNFVLSIGIYFCIEDIKLEIKNKKRFGFFLGLISLSLIIIRSFLLNSVEDKYYYLNLPFGIFALIIILKPLNQLFEFRNIILISFLLPLRKLFYIVFINFFVPLTRYLTWFVLYIIGKNPVFYNKSSLLIDDIEIKISNGCAGVDNLYFVLSIGIIYMLIFRLKDKFNIFLFSIFSFLISITVNIFRNTLIAIVVSSNNLHKDYIYHFLHDSYGSLIFSFISVSIISFFYFKLLNKELSIKDKI